MSHGVQGGPAPWRAGQPEEDRDLSAYTGWTRAHWENLADTLLTGVRPYASAGHGLIDLPGPASANGTWSDGLEGFARTFLLAAFRLAGAGGADPLGLAEWYARGLERGADPASPERWPTFPESNQAKVEAASIAIALHETRPWIWDRLTERTRAQLLDWFGLMVGDEMPGNNWIWFQAVTESFARTAGGSWRTEDLERTITLTDDWYADDGWYSDGLTGAEHRNYDHYSGWAMHFYPLWFCRISGDRTPPGLLDRYRRRLRRYLTDYPYLIGGNGAPLFQGRSLTYRFAALAPLWTGALHDADPLAPGLTRRLASGMLRHFTDHGAVDRAGLLPLGWHGAFPRIRQVYSGPASPYWAAKGFAGLLLPPDHPVWTAPEEPLPVERGDTARQLTAPGWTVSGTAADGVVRVLNHGSDHADPHRWASDDPVYARLAFSTHTAPDMPEDPTGGPVDSHVALVDRDERASHRRPLHRIRTDGHVGVSRSRAHWPQDEKWDPFGGPDTRYRLGPWITVAGVVRGATEIRVVRVDPADPAGDEDGRQEHPGPWRLRIGGWSLASADHSGTWTGPLPAAEARQDDGLVSSVTGLRGLHHAEVRTARAANAFGPRSSTPALLTLGPVAYGHLYAAAVHLGTERPEADALPAVVERRDPDGAAVDVVWPSGDRDSLRLDPPPRRG